MGQLAYDDYAQARKVPGSGQPGSNCKDEKPAEHRCFGWKGWATQTRTNVIHVERC